MHVCARSTTSSLASTSFISSVERMSKHDCSSYMTNRRARRLGVTVECRRRRAKDPGMFEVRIMTPPPKSLGIHSLPPGTTSGEVIEVEGEWYMVHKMVCQYKFERGKYVREHNRLDVERSERWVVNQFLDDLFKRSPTK